MKQLDGVGREHEEFRLRLEKDKEIELAGINVRKEIADARAAILDLRDSREIGFRLVMSRKPLQIFLPFRPLDLDLLESCLCRLERG